MGREGRKEDRRATIKERGSRDKQMEGDELVDRQW